MLILFIILIVFITILVSKVVRSIKSTIRRARSTIGDVATIARVIDSAVNTGEVKKDIRHVGGATNIFLPLIAKDFPDFHNHSAESDVRTFVEEFINILYGKDTGFKKSRILTTVRLEPNKVKSSVVSNFKINRIAIYGYKKTKEYATIIYRISAGFNVDSERYEEAYDVMYTYQISEHEISTFVAKCTNCGAPINDLQLSKCPYCDAAFIKDTIMSWDVSDIKAI